MSQLEHAFQLSTLSLLAGGGFLWMCKSLFRLQNKGLNTALLAVLSLLSLFSIWTYTRFGTMHDLPKYGKQNFHMAEIFLYYQGSKYFAETGSFDLYNCAVVALDELRAEDPKRPLPVFADVNDLRRKPTPVPAPEISQKYSGPCREAFTDERWAAFKKDLSTLFKIAPYDLWWATAFMDAGYNSSPAFAAMAGSVAGRLDLSLWWKYLGYFDLILIAGVGSFLIYRAFGSYPAAAFLIIFGTNPLSSYLWTGGSFFRQAWFFGLILGICCLKKERFWTAGMCFGYAAADRLFPALFAFGAAWPLLYSSILKRVPDRRLLRFVCGAIAAAGVLWAVSVARFGLDSWKDFAANMAIHNHPFYVPHVGLKKAVVYFSGIGNRNFWWADGMKRLVNWSEMQWGVLNQRKALYVFLSAAYSLGALIVSRKEKPYVASLLAGGTLLYVLLLPARYYYIYLALFPVVYYQNPSGVWNNLRLTAFFAAILSCLIAEYMVIDHILRMTFFSFALGALFAALIGLEAAEGWSKKISSGASKSPA